MKIDTLAFIQNLLQHNQPVTVFHPHSPILVPTVIHAASDSFYKISSEALLVLESLVKVLRPLDTPDNAASGGGTAAEYQRYVKQVLLASIAASLLSKLTNRHLLLLYLLLLLIRSTTAVMFA